jgi:hypothetical protein
LLKSCGYLSNNAENQIAWADSKAVCERLRAALLRLVYPQDKPYKMRRKISARGNDAEKAKLGHSCHVCNERD